jgi:hypothetical protein
MAMCLLTTFIRFCREDFSPAYILPSTLNRSIAIANGVTLWRLKYSLR